MEILVACASSDLNRGKEPIQHGHSNVEKHHIGLQLLRLLDNFEAIACLADDLPLGSFAQYFPDSHTPLDKVVGDENCCSRR